MRVNFKHPGRFRGDEYFGARWIANDKR